MRRFRPRALLGGGVVRSWRVLRSTAPPNGAAQPRRYQPRAELVTLPLTLHVATSFSRAVCPVSAGGQPRPRRRLVKVVGFFGAKRLPSTNAPLREPATVLTALPPRGGFRSPFASSAPRSFPRDASKLDPMRLRLGQAPFVDFCNQNDPRARAANPPIPQSCPRSHLRAHGSGEPRPRSPQVRRSGMNRARSSRAFSGQGPRMANASSAPLVSIAREESFAPTQLARTPRVVDS